MQNGIYVPKKYYRYGVEILLSTILEVVLVMLLGVLMKNLVGSIIFYIVFVTTRFYTGGYHAETHFKCKATLLLCCMVNIIFTKYIKSMFVYGLLLLVASSTILCFTPIENIHKVLTDELKQKNKTLSIIVVCLHTILSFVFCFIKPSIARCIVFTLLDVAILMVITKIQKRRSEQWIIKSISMFCNACKRSCNSCKWSDILV